MRMLRKRYDPWPDLLARSGDLQRRVVAKAKSGEFSPDQARAANKAIRQTFEDFTTYATVGRDRKKLTSRFVDDMERDACELIDLVLRMHSASHANA